VKLVGMRARHPDHFLNDAPENIDAQLHASSGVLLICNNHRLTATAPGSGHSGQGGKQKAALCAAFQSRLTY